MAAPKKELFTRRYNAKIINAVRRVKEKTGKDHTRFIEEAIDEKLLREKHIRKSILAYEPDN